MGLFNFRKKNAQAPVSNPRNLPVSSSRYTSRGVFNKPFKLRPHQAGDMPNYPVLAKGQSSGAYRPKGQKFKKVAAGFGRQAFRGAKAFGSVSYKGVSKGAKGAHKGASGMASRSWNKGRYGHCQKCGRPSGDYPLCKYCYNSHKLSKFGHFGRVK